MAEMLRRHQTCSMVRRPGSRPPRVYAEHATGVPPKPEREAAMKRPTATQSGRVQEVAELLRTRVLVCDGAMGTMLHAAGASLDLSLPELSVSRPDLVRAIHGAYIAAGAEVIETNTFGACQTRL